MSSLAKHLLERLDDFLWYLRFVRSALRYRGTEAIVLMDRNSGFFSIYFQAMCAYRIAQFNRQKILFQFDSGPYFSAERTGRSWWDYYFDSSECPLTVQGALPIKHRVIEQVSEQIWLSLIGFHFTRKAANRVWQQLAPRQEVLERIDQFASADFEGKFVIGLHYRGTDRVTGPHADGPRVDYSFVQMVLSEIANTGIAFRLFVATDEEAFIQYLERECAFDCYHTEMQRSTSHESLHLGQAGGSPYQVGLEALVDAVLLSRCHVLLRTDSNLSKASEFFNPELQSINLSNLAGRQQGPNGEGIRAGVAEVVSRIQAARASGFQSS